jgi:hypothetical protein
MLSVVMLNLMLSVQIESIMLCVVMLSAVASERSTAEQHFIAQANLWQEPTWV